MASDNPELDAPASRNSLADGKPQATPGVRPVSPRALGAGTLVSVLLIIGITCVTGGGGGPRLTAAGQSGLIGKWQQEEGTVTAALGAPSRNGMSGALSYRMHSENEQLEGERGRAPYPASISGGARQCVAASALTRLATSGVPRPLAASQPVVAE